MTKKKRTYTPEFKQEAIKLAKSNSVTKTASDLGVAPVSIRNWIKNNENAPSDPDGVDWKKEAKRLKKENQYLKEINDILKKSTAIFSQEKFPPFK
jgi:transposase